MTYSIVSCGSGGGVFFFREMMFRQSESIPGTFTILH